MHLGAAVEEALQVSKAQKNVNFFPNEFYEVYDKNSPDSF
jgi:hypothetical protein